MRSIVSKYMQNKISREKEPTRRWLTSIIGIKTRACLWENGMDAKRFVYLNISQNIKSPSVYLYLLMSTDAPSLSLFSCQTYSLFFSTWFRTIRSLLPYAYRSIFVYFCPSHAVFCESTKQMRPHCLSTILIYASIQMLLWYCVKWKAKAKKK